MHGKEKSKHTVFSTHHGYLATKPSRDTCTFSTRSNDAGSLNDSRITVNECTGDSEPKSWSANNTGSMHFVSVVSSMNTKEKRPLLAAGLSLRAGDRGFPPATRSLSPGYFVGK